MNNIVGMFTGFDGRIGRQQWWIGAIIIGVAYLILSWVLGLILGGGMMVTNWGQAVDPAVLQRQGWIGLISWVVLGYPWVALATKRRHDRDNNGIDAIAFIAVLLVVNLIMGLGWILNILGTILGIVFLVYAVYMLVVLGFLKGTTGANQYGADPLGGAA